MEVHRFEFAFSTKKRQHCWLQRQQTECICCCDYRTRLKLLLYLISSRKLCNYYGQSHGWPSSSCLAPLLHSWLLLDYDKVLKLHCLWALHGSWKWPERNGCKARTPSLRLPQRDYSCWRLDTQPHKSRFLLPSFLLLQSRQQNLFQGSRSHCNRTEHLLNSQILALE